MKNMQIYRKISVIISPINGGNAIAFNDFRVCFEIQKTNETKVQNTAKVQIYNVSDNSFNFIKKENMAISIFVGWGESAEHLIFYGKITRVSKEKKDTDWILKIESGDSSEAYNSTKLNKSYPENTQHTHIFNDAKNELLKDKVIKGVKGLFNSDNLFSNGYAANGNAANVIDNILTTNNYEWQINNGILEVQKKGESKQTIKLSSRSGLIGSPEVTGSGIKVNCLLQPEITPLKKIYVESINIKGVFNVIKVTHSGDTHEGKWQTTFETKEIN
ncbi:MAG: hypothetical protein DCC88_00295 [Spirobacillus cienkowskii]|uniref:Uncharacterized protein n=1 Tax=Spirobacillus cienkowskii TaxID=495820 RepID=A0A369KVK7_9BACT|nr:MAG: hypothetical protein DCC88_00295 [Spirobacillus cienkowskii]